jgi:hypothetical protein
MNIRTLTTTIVLIATAALFHVTPAAALEIIGSPFGHGAEGNFLGGITVDPITGDVYQAEREANRIVKYNQSGTFILTFGKEVNETTGGDICTAASGNTCKAGVPGLGAGELDSPAGVAVDPNSEDVYVNAGAGGLLGQEGNRVERFNSNGQYLSQIIGGQNGAPEFVIDFAANGVATDTEGNLYIASSGLGSVENGVLKFNPAGEYTGRSFPVKPGTPINIAVDANGIVYVSGDEKAVLKFAPNGAVLGELACRNDELTLDGVAVDLFNGDVFVTGSDFFSKNEEAESYVCRYDAAGNKLEEFKAVQGKQRLDEIAYGASAGRLYEALNTGVWMYGTFPLPVQGAPTVSREDWSGPGLTAITLSARVNPNSLDTSYFFQYSTSPDLSGATDIPIPPGDAGSSFLPVSESVSLTGLSQSTTYYYRMVAHNEFGGGAGSTVEGPIQAFTTLAPPPSVTTEAASEETFGAATVHGTVVPGSTGAASNTLWCFQYGTTDTPPGVYDLGFAPGAPAGEAGQGTSPVAVSIRLTRLQPETTYRYRLVAVNSLGSRLPSTACGSEGGHETDGAEATFTTGASGPGPIATTGPFAALTQSTATLTGTVNPNGTRTVYDFQLGIDTKYGVDLLGEAGESSETATVSMIVTGLQPETTYHYRLVATSRFGASYGADQSFTTPEYPGSTLSAPPTPPLLQTPSIPFPPTETKKVPHPPKCRHGYTHNKHGKCIKTKPKKKKKK